MNRILVVVFSEISKAFAGADSLRSLDHEDSITLYAWAIITKNADGTSIVNEEHNRFGVRTLAGTSLGSLIGLLGGPAGVAIGAAAGSLAGIAADLDNARIGSDFVDEVSRLLTPGTFALLADIEEEWTPWVDLRMEELGGVVYRRALSDVKHTIHEDNVAAMKADLAQMQAEHGKTQADRKAKLQEKINQLDSRIQEHLQKAKERREASEKQTRAKVQILKEKAAAAKEKAAEMHV